MEKVACRNCRYIEVVGKLHGKCHLNPPHHSGHHEVVMLDGWCGQHKQPYKKRKGKTDAAKAHV